MPRGDLSQAQVSGATGQQHGTSPTTTYNPNPEQNQAAAAQTAAADSNSGAWGNWAYQTGLDTAGQYMSGYGQGALDRLGAIQNYAGQGSYQLAQDSYQAGTTGGNNLYNLAQSYANQQQGQGAYMGQQLANAGAAYGGALQQAGQQALQGGQAQVGAINNVAGNVEQAANDAYRAQLAAASAAQKYGTSQAASLSAAAQNALRYGQDAAYMQQAAANGAAGYGQQQALMTQRLAGDSAAGLSRLGGQLLDSAAGAAARGAINPDFTRQNQALTEASGTTYGLAGLERTEGPSAAQSQLQSGLNAAQASNLAMARSGRGWGGSASAQRDAAFQNAAAGQQAANQAAMLRAQENAAWRQRQAANLGAAAGLQQAAGQQYGQQQALATQAGLQSRSINDAQQQALLGQAGNLYTQGAQIGLQGQVQGAQLGQAGQAQQIAALQNAAATGQSSYAQQLAAQQAAGQLGLSAYGQQLAGMGQAQQGYNQAQGQVLGALQGAGQLQQGAYGQNLAALQGAANTSLGALQSGQVMAAGQLNQAANTAMGGLQSGTQLGLQGIGQAGQLMNAGVAQQLAAEQQMGATYGAYTQAQQQAALNALNAYATEAGVAQAQQQANNQLLAAGLQTGGALLGGVAGMFAGGPAGAAAGAAGGGAAGNWLAGEFTDFSDERVKTDIAEADAASLDLLDKAPGYTYRYKNPDVPGAAPGRFLGPMAQDLEKSELGASLVATGPDGLKRVNGSRAGLAALGGLSALKRSFRADLDRLAREIDALKPKRKAA